MKRLLLASMLVGSLGALPSSRPADAAAVDCLVGSVNECNADFSPDSEYLIAIRGWCYIIRIGLCWLF